MASCTFRVSSTQCWIYPPQTYTGYDGIHKTRNHWYNGHSVLSRRGYRCYQGGNSQMDGRFNGNMMSFFFFRVNGNGNTINDWIRSIGGAGKITRITMRVYCGDSMRSSMKAQICVTPYWSPELKWGQGGISECPYDSYDQIGIRKITTQYFAEKQFTTVDLTSWKYDIASNQSICLYAPGAYNRDNSVWGWVAGELYPDKSPVLTIEYNDNSAPRTPSIQIHTRIGSHGYITPNLDFSVISNGDPDNNLGGSPYSYILYNQNGEEIYGNRWTSQNRFQYDLSSYRGQTVKIRGRIQDGEELSASKDINIYINSQSYWRSNERAAWFSYGVNNSIFEENVTLNWNRAYDDQPEHNKNLRYRIYVQKGNDIGPTGDVWENAIVEGLTGTSYTFNATNMTTLSGKRITINKGERVYFSIWANDGLEWSINRATSEWIYREKPPSRPSNISPNSGHWEDNVTVSWSASSGINGSYIVKYKVYLCDKNNVQIRSYETSNTSIICNDLTAIARGDKFFFRVIAVDNMGKDSDPGETSWLIRNGYPSTPSNFNPNPNQQWFKNSIPLAWGASRDPDGDEVKYDVFYNVNGGTFIPLTKGISSTYCTHDISGYSPGTQFNYYVEAYDTFGVRSWKAYTSTQPKVNIPPTNPTILLPQTDRAIYSRNPRITFKINNSQTGKNVKVIIKVNGYEYNSVDHNYLFNKQWYGNEEGMFIIPNDKPLNYSKTNNIEMKTFDGLDYSTSVTTNIPVEAPTVNKIAESEDRLIKADELNKIRQMINKNRFAYTLSEIDWYNGVDINNKILYKYFDQAHDKIFELMTFLNNKTEVPNLKRDTNIDKTKINKAYFNELLNIIIKP